MKGFKCITAIVLICTMIMSMGLIRAFALEADPQVSENWTPMAAKYSLATHKIIAPKSNNYEIKTEGFTFSEHNGRISVHTPGYAAFAGGYGTSVLTAATPTVLDGLNVVISPDDFDFTVDPLGNSSTLGILWTEESVESIAGFNEITAAYDTGLSDAVKASSNGLRYLIPTPKDADKGIPAALAENPCGKALYISVTNRNTANSGTLTASDVNIVYYDGSYINKIDGHPGYRWVFTARNGDSSGIISEFREIDISDGLTVNVRADERLGYIVNINGVDYYKGSEVAYFPDANTDGTSHNYLYDEDYIYETEAYRNTMTYAKADIDLTGLREAGAGYLTVGAVSVNDKYLTDYSCDYTLVSVNSVPAAEWKGESNSHNPYITSDGVHITLHNLYDIKDLYIAKGKYKSYRELKNAGYIVGVGAAKLGARNEYTYTVTELGVHTAVIRYNDGSTVVLHRELTVYEPVFTVDGLQVTVSNIPGVKVIRTAYGEYNTPGDTKRAPGSRNFSNKNDIRNADSYLLQYREEGRVTVVVEYDNGYVKIFHCDIIKKAPTVERKGNTVTFGNLEGLKVLRYAVGEYSTSAEIKKAEGSKALKLGAAVDGYITVTGLADEIYTFCVQYDDESYYYYRYEPEAEKDSTLRFHNDYVEGFETIEVKMNVGEAFSEAFGGSFPDPGLTRFELDEEIYEFVGWYLEELNFLLTEGDMDNNGYLAIAGNWEFYAYYEVI